MLPRASLAPPCSLGALSVLPCCASCSLDASFKAILPFSNEMYTTYIYYIYLKLKFKNHYFETRKGAKPL